ncbi:MAG: hypothetical protein WC438_03385 [Candidatus Pacearchaeota archaeon]
MEEQIQMIAAASRLLSFKKNNPLAIPEEIFQDLSDYISEEEINENHKVYMIAAASKALEISKKNPRLKEKEVLNLLMKDIPEIINSLEQINNPNQKA